MKKIRNVERKEEGTTHKRYFVELLLHDRKSKHDRIASEYIMEKITDGQLCFPKGFVWKRNSIINIILVVTQENEWMFYRAIQNLDNLVTQTQDKHIRFVIVDSLPRKLKKQKLKLVSTLETKMRTEYQIMAAEYGFSTDMERFNFAIDEMEDYPGIVIPFDPYLEVIDPIFFDDVRKVS